MSSADLKRDFAVEVVQTLTRAGFTALWAGGCVRDLLLGKSADDYDVATNAHPDQVRELFGPRRTLAIGASFGVVLVHGPRGRGGANDVEVATFRTEGPYLDGRHPQHVSYATPEEDAQRRDFTINGMFYDPLAETILDYVGGQEDLAKRVVRAIGDPHARIKEDKLRMLRAVRITARFDFELDRATANAVCEMAPEMLVVSHERITQELKKMLVHSRRARAVELARDMRLLTVILPELAPVVATAGLSSADDRWRLTVQTLDRLENPRFALALAALLRDLRSGKSSDEAGALAVQICRRLKLSNQESDDVAWLIAHEDALRGAAAMPPRHLKRLLAKPLIGELLALERAHTLVANTSDADVAFCENCLHALPMEEINPAPLINGEDLIALGLVPGAQFKELLEIIRDAQLDGLIGTREEALERVVRTTTTHKRGTKSD